MLITFSEEGKKWLGDAGYDPVYGARPLKRAIQNEVLNKLAELMIEGKAAEGDAVHVVVEDNKLGFIVDQGKATKHFKELGRE
jgi:ATP-dependent Clp protease ATP-binding subunit ClpB